mmetsp:Transcript_6876/g.12774  ORF Transcript_6876/g.12774 Transcript_6876/m.12774 type:complete len:225 (+) Transcript_6876:265-939(+)
MGGTAEKRETHERTTPTTGSLDTSMFVQLLFFFFFFFFGSVVGFGFSFFHFSSMSLSWPLLPMPCSFASSDLCSRKGLMRPNATSFKNLETSGPVSLTREVKAPCSSLRRFLGVSNSATRPRSITRTLSASMMVLMRCAIVNIVQSLNSFRMVFWMSSSVRVSTAAVASSSTSILEWRSNARAMHSNCRCPTEKFSPPASTSTSSTVSGTSSSSSPGNGNGTAT